MATITITTSEEFALHLTPTEGTIVNNLGAPAKVEFESQITEWLIMKDAQRITKRNRKVLNKMLSAESSTQAAVIDLLFP